MKCRRLRFNDSTAWLHRLGCPECRKYRREDAEIQHHIDAYAAHLADRPVPAALLTDVPSGGRSKVWGLGYTVLCVGIGAAASLAILLAIPHLPAKKASLPSEVSASRSGANQSKSQKPLPGGKSVTTVFRNPLPQKHSPKQAPEIVSGPKEKPRYAFLGTSWETDLDYINEGQSVLTNLWQSARATSRNVGVQDYHPFRPPMKDDFVAPLDLTVAASGASVGDQAAAIEAEYNRQAAISDDRLAKGVTFESKCDSLAEVCASLTKQTGVQIYAGRSVADDNVTLYMTNRPARDVMRTLTRLFGYLWHRTGTNGVYTYTFEQEMKDQVAEDKLRNEDVTSVLSQVVDAAKKAAPKREPSPLDRPVVEDVIRKQFGRLSIDEFQQLRTGKDVVLSSEPGANRPLESDKAITLMDNMGRLKPFGNDYLWTGGDGLSPSEVPGTVAKLIYKLSVLELGGIRAQGSVEIHVKKPTGGIMVLPTSTVLADLPGVGEANPNNAAINADSAHLPEFTGTVKIDPAKRIFQKKEKDYPIRTWTEYSSAGGAHAWLAAGNFVPPREYMTTGDFWEAVHKATGMDIAADCYSRMYAHHTRSGPFFELLNTYCDETLTRWHYQDKTLFARSTVYEWQRLSETPKRIVEHWKVSHKRGSLTIHDLIAMAQLSDRQLDSVYAGGTVFHYHDVREWGMVARPWMREYGYTFRKFLRTLGSLSPATLDQMVNKPFDLEKLPQGVRTQLLDNVGMWPNGYPVSVAVDYIPTESYYWRPAGDRAVEALGVTAPSSAELRRALEKRDFTPGDQEIVHTMGHLKLVFYGPNRRTMLEVGDGGPITYLTGN